MRGQGTFQAGPVNRRKFLKQAGVIAAVGALHSSVTAGAETVTLPFENGERELVKYPQKRPLLRLTSRPPQLETPMEVFDESIITPNDAFFVRYHLTKSPPPENQLQLRRFKLRLKGSIKNELSLTLDDLKSNFDPVEIVAVNQCSGNSRGFAEPRVPGGQSGNGMMGNARWKGVRLKDVLDRAGINAGARQVTFNGLDAPLLPKTPDYIKALDVDHARDGEVMLAYEMNGTDLPWLNGYPLRLVVPGYYGTYWIKHLHEIEVIDDVFDGWWMNPAYRIPDDECACVPPGTKPDKTIPINRLNVRSFITSLADGAKVKAGEAIDLRGFAFDGGTGIKKVEISVDDGQSWNEAALGNDLGKYSFRGWTYRFTPKEKRPYVLKVRATNNAGQIQPDKAHWNPSGYMRNVIEQVRVTAA